MINEPKNIDFYTNGKQTSDEEFMRISKWIKKQKNNLSGPIPKGKKKMLLPI
jgi:hypothetical protein